MRALASVFILTFFTIASAEPGELELIADDEACEVDAAEVLVANGLGRITLFVEGRRDGAWLCFEAALDLATRALRLAEGEHTPRGVADSKPELSATAWWNRPTAALAGPDLAETIWPAPPREVASGAWVFFATSPDLSPHWYWIEVSPEPLENSTFRVRVWSEQ